MGEVEFGADAPHPVGCLGDDRTRPLSPTGARLIPLVDPTAAIKTIGTQPMVLLCHPADPCPQGPLQGTPPILCGTAGDSGVNLNHTHVVKRPQDVPDSARTNGQSLAEFALVVPLFLALVGGIIQFGLLFWAQNTLTQVVRDTGRWAATQQATPCSSTTQRDAVNTQANAIAANSSLLGYTTNGWTGPTLDTTDAQVQSYATANSLAVAWVADSDPAAKGCPPQDNKAVYHVIIKANQTIPTFFPAMQYLPGLGTCDSSGCHITLSSTAQFRMEPAP